MTYLLTWLMHGTRTYNVCIRMKDFLHFIVVLTLRISGIMEISHLSLFLLYKHFTSISSLLNFSYLVF